MNLSIESNRPQAATDPDEPQRPAEFVAANPWLFESIHSYDWFVRKNYGELVEAGALIRPTGRNLVVPAAFKRVAMAVGARRAKGVQTDARGLSGQVGNVDIPPQGLATTNYFVPESGGVTDAEAFVTALCPKGC